MCEEKGAKCDKTGLNCKCKTGLTQETVKEHFNYDLQTGQLTWKTAPYDYIKAGAPVGKLRKDGYIRVWFKGTMYEIQTLIWLWYYGNMPETTPENVDRNVWNNRIDNLREANNTSFSITNIKGINFFVNAESWKLNFFIGNRHEYLGLCSDLDEAICMRLAVEQALNWRGCHSNSPAYLYVKNKIQTGRM